MRNVKLRLEDSMSFDPGLEESLSELREDQDQGRTGSGRLMRAALRVALSQELTRRQRECVELYFGERLTLEETGERLGIGKSTVYKHIETAKGRIRRVMAYAQAFQAAMDEEDKEK